MWCVDKLAAGLGLCKAHLENHISKFVSILLNMTIADMDLTRVTLCRARRSQLGEMMSSKRPMIK